MITEQDLTSIDLWASGWAGEGSAEFAAVTRLVAFSRQQREQLNEYWRAVVRLEQAGCSGSGVDPIGSAGAESGGGEVISFNPTYFRRKHQI